MLVYLYHDLMMNSGLSADVYSFGILMWEMFTLKYAFEEYTRATHFTAVVLEGKRPKVVNSWPFHVKDLLCRCWHQMPLERPSFDVVSGLIQSGLDVDKKREDDLMDRSYLSQTGCKIEDFQNASA